MSWLTWPIRIIWFVLWFVKEIFVASGKVIRDNLTPGHDSTPGIARVPTRCANDFELTLLAALITITPGTLTLGTETERDVHTLFVHGLYSGDADALRAEVRRLESSMLKATRRRGVAR